MKKLPREDRVLESCETCKVAEKFARNYLRRIARRGHESADRELERMGINRRLRGQIKKLIEAGKFK